MGKCLSSPFGRSRQPPERCPQPLTGYLAHAGDLLEAGIVQRVNAVSGAGVVRRQAEATAAVMIERVD
jgi:hypothetical protein